MSVLQSDMINSKTFLELVADGLVEGQSFVDKFGENEDIDDVFETVTSIGGLYVAPTAARVHNVASTLAADAGTLVSSGTSDSDGSDSLIDSTATFSTDGVVVGDVVVDDTNVLYGYVTAVTSETELAIGGSVKDPSSTGPGRDVTGFESGVSYRVVTKASTGAPVMYISGLDGDKLKISEFVILNGAAGILTAKSYLRQSRAKVFGTGTAGAAGTISSIAQTDGTTTLQLINGNNQTLMCVDTVPSDSYANLYSWRCALSRKVGAASSVQVRVGDFNSIGYVTRTEGLGSTGTSRFEERFDPPLRIEGGTDIWINADSDTVNTGVSAGFTMVVVKK